MRAYTELLVTDLPPARRARDRRHGRVHPQPARPRDQRGRVAKVREDKQREAGDGFDGSWVAHPDLVPLARRLRRALGDQPNQIDRLRDDVHVSAAQILDVRPPPARSPKPGCATTSASRSSTSRLAARRRRRRHLQPDGRRRDRRDLPLPGLAMGPQRRPPWPRRHRSPATWSSWSIAEETRDDPRRTAGPAFDAPRYDQAVVSLHRGGPGSATTPSSSPSPPTSACRDGPAAPPPGPWSAFPAMPSKSLRDRGSRALGSAGWG